MLTFAAVQSKATENRSFHIQYTVISNLSLTMEQEKKTASNSKDEGRMARYRRQFLEFGARRRAAQAAAGSRGVRAGSAFVVVMLLFNLYMIKGADVSG